MSRKMTSGIHQGTTENLMIGAGALYKNFVSPANRGELLGATKGGNSVKIDTQFHVAEVDGALGALKGGRWITGITVEIETNLLEITKANLKLSLPGSFIDTFDPDYDMIQQYSELTDADYTNIALVGELTGANKPIIFIVDNVIAVEAAELPLGSGKDDVVLKLKLQGHYTDIKPNEPPYKILYPKNLTAVGTPTSSIPSGEVADNATVTLSTTTAGATIIYTIDGSLPSQYTNGEEYTTPIVITDAMVIKAIAVVGDDISNVATFTYTIAP